MAHRIEESDLLVHPVNYREERTSLLSSMSDPPKPLSLLSQLSCLPCNVCFKSKPALLVLLWNVYIGAVYTYLINSFTVLGFMWQNNNDSHSDEEDQKLNVVIWTVLSAYALLALTLLLYPLSGFLADVYCGHYKAVTISFVILWIAMFFTSIVMVMTYFEDKSDWSQEMLKKFLILFVVLSLILLIVGLASYQANIIQLGLDQLLEAPSESLGLFVHWLMWSHSLGSVVIIVVLSIFPCFYSSVKKIVFFVGCLPIVFLFISSLLLAFTCYNHSWFYSEPGQNNPYKTVFQVLNFVKKNKYPLRRSAFTFCDDFRPSRIDFAKERFGGPFTSPQVEDVKTFLRIVLVLFTLGPVFVLDIPGSLYLFPLFALHTSNKLQFVGEDVHCESPAVWIIVQSGSCGVIVSLFVTIVYIWVVYSLLRRRIPKMFNRLTCSFVLLITGVVYMFVADLVGHGIYHHEKHDSKSNICIFTTLFSKTEENHAFLHMHWSVVIPPSILLNVGCLLIHATAMEFISAQSPHSMKGLLVGVFFAIKGIFQFISAAAVVPFAIPNIWNHINSVTNCGFGYYLFTIVVASIGLVVFSVVVRRYRYRQRDERPYDTRFAEAYYERYIGSTNSSAAAALHSPNDDLTYHDQYGITVSVNEDTTASDSEDYSATEDSKLLHKLPDNISSR